MNEKFDFAAKLQQSSRIKKPIHFFEDFCLALYRKCEDVRKGFKVEATFVSQGQVNLVIKHGGDILGHDIIKEDLKSVRSFWKFSFFIFYRNLLTQNMLSSNTHSGLRKGQQKFNKTDDVESCITLFLTCYQVMSHTPPEWAIQ